MTGTIIVMVFLLGCLIWLFAHDYRVQRRRTPDMFYDDSLQQFLLMLGSAQCEDSTLTRIKANYPKRLAAAKRQLAYSQRLESKKQVPNRRLRKVGP